ncbi:MAG: hypothetical protein HY927_11490 [Elusimicrobia bacterium]|nr:hypothetical protein [Elusimicrobiota bacterium]
MSDKPVDFSQGATKKAVLKATLENPVTMYSTGVGMLGALAIGLFGMTALPVAAAVGGLGIGVGSWLVNYFVRGRSLADRHVQKIYEELLKRRQRLLTGLEQTLGKVGRDARGDVRDYAGQASSQLAMARERFETLKATLEAKLNPGEMTYARYVGAAEQVYLSVLDNLSVMASMLRSVGAIDPAYIASRHKALKALKSPADADRREFETLEERGRLLREKLDKVNELLTQNEVAITRMDQLGASLAELKISSQGGSVDLDTAIQEMENLAKQAHRYEE